MREIKFRVWKHKHQYPANNEEKMIYFNLGDYAYDQDGEQGNQYIDLNEMPIMQYTDLKDKNGKEIYEGDILLVKERMHNSVVEYHKGCFRGCDYSSKTRVLLEVFNEDSEVIGNIYESPELLTKGGHNETQSNPTR